MIATENDSSSDNKNANNVSLPVNAGGGVSINEASENNTQRIADPTIETDSAIKCNANTTIRSSSKRKRDIENNVVSARTI